MNETAAVVPHASPMSTQIHEGFARRTVGRSTRGGPITAVARVGDRLARALWLPDRGVGELRWTAVTMSFRCSALSTASAMASFFPVYDHCLGPSTWIMPR